MSSPIQPVRIRPRAKTRRTAPHRLGFLSALREAQEWSLAEAARRFAVELGVPKRSAAAMMKLEQKGTRSPENIRAFARLYGMDEARMGEHLKRIWMEQKRLRLQARLADFS